MKCPVCEPAGDLSKVYPYGPTIEAPRVDQHWDEQGLYHFHDSRIRLSTYRCTNNHFFTWRQGIRCPVDKCSHNQTVVARTLVIHDSAPHLPAKRGFGVGFEVPVKDQDGRPVGSLRVAPAPGQNFTIDEANLTEGGVVTITGTFYPEMATP